MPGVKRLTSDSSTLSIFAHFANLEYAIQSDQELRCALAILESMESLGKPTHELPLIG